MRIDHFEPAVDLLHPEGFLSDLSLRHIAVLQFGQLFELLEQGRPLNIAIEEMLEHRDVVALDLLLDLQHVDIPRELLDLAATYRVNQTSLTDAVATDETVLATLDQLEVLVLE